MVTPAFAGPAGLLGRERELVDVAELLARGPLVTVTGPAGVGKSKLARQVALAGQWRGRATADLLTAPDPKAALECLHAAVSATTVSATTETAASDVRSRPGLRLVLVDNCDLFLGVLAEEAAALGDADPDLRILATTRERLGLSEETVYRLRPLPDPVAADLLTLRIGAQQDGVVPEISPEIRQICAKLDGLPLALELAAAQARLLTPAQIAGRLDDPLGLLVGIQRGGTPRHRSVRDALNWGAKTLTETERCLLGRLSVFAGEFTIDSAEQVCAGPGLSSAEVLFALARLADKSLVECDHSGALARYRLLRVVREYAGELLGRSGEADAARRAMARHALASPGATSCTDLVAATRWSLVRGTPPQALLLAVGAAPYLLAAGRPGEGADLLAEALAGFEAAAPAGGAGDCGTAAGSAEARGPGDAGDRADSGDPGGYPADLLVRGLLAKGMLDVVIGRADAAGRAAAEAEARCRRTGDERGRLWAGVLAGAALAAAEPHAAAIRMAAAAAQLADRTPRDTAAEVIWSLAAAEAGRLPLAREAAARALASCGDGAAADSGRHPPLRELALVAAGRVACEEARLDDARALLLEARELAQRPDAAGIAALASAELCRLGMREAGPGGSLEPALDRAIALCAETASPPLLALALDIAGQARLRERRDPAASHAARDAFARVVALSKETGTSHAAAGILGLGQVALAGGSASAAWTLIEEAHAIASEGCGPALLARTLQAVGDCAGALGDVSRAWAAYHRALATRADAGLASAAVETLEALACMAVEQGRAEYGTRLLGAAEGLRAARGNPRSGPETDRFDAAIEAAGTSLGADALAGLRAAGANMSLAEAVSYAGRQRGPRQRGTGWVSLTPAERQVADLAATGMTNREIGERLFSSPRTVQAHLSHVFAKLGISSRKMLAVEIAARNRQLPSHAG